MFEELRGVLSERCPGERLEFALMTGYNPYPTAKSIAIGYGVEQRLPLFLVKIGRKPAARELLENGHFNINAVMSDERLKALSANFPRSVYASRLEGNFVQVEEFISGEDLLSLTLRQKDHRHYLDMVTQWLKVFHSLTKVERVFDEGLMKLQCGCYLDAAAQVFSGQQWFRDASALFNDYARRLSGVSLPMVFAHYDFAPKNIRIENGDLKVIDWEFSRREGLPLVDLLHFYLRYYAKIHKATYLESFIKVLYGPKESFFNSGISDYASGLGIPGEAVPFLILFHSFMRLSKVRNYRDELVEFFKRVSGGEIMLDKINI